MSTPVSPTLDTRFRVPSLCCPEEAGQVRAALAAHEGVVDVHVDLIARRVHVEFDPALVSEADLSESLAAAGHASVAAGQHVPAPPLLERLRHGLVLLSGILWGSGLAIGLASGTTEDLRCRALFALAAATAGMTFARKAWDSLRHVRPDMNLLMSAAIVGALVLGEWSEAAAVSFLFALAEYLEERSLDRARAAVAALLDLRPATARLVADGAREGADSEPRIVPVADVPLNAALRVLPGDLIPLDGTLIDGSTQVNEAAITGESLPVLKEPGAPLFAGTLNGDGAFLMKVNKASGDTTLDRILHLVEEAQATRAPTQRFVDRFAAVYTPTVLALSAIVCLVPPLLGFGSFHEWFYRGLVLLVIACPCALVISTPVTLVSGIAAAARNGILVKGGASLEQLGRLRVIAFDKTGTLTDGDLRVEAIHALAGSSEDEVLTVAAALETSSTHPIAVSILREARERGLDLPVVASGKTSPGRGVEGEILLRSRQRKALVGRPSFASESGIPDGPTERQVRESAASGRALALVALDGKAIGVIELSDRTRKGAAEALAELRRAGIKRLVVLTGDRETSARRTLGDLDLDEIRAGLLPEEKLSELRRLETEHGSSGMVGDGVNDAPALAGASVGIAMGAAGSDAALEAADVALMADDLSKVATAVRIGRATEAKVRFNIGLALALKAVFMVLAVTGTATLWMAVAADMGASLLVVANGLSLLPRNAKVG